MKVYRKPGPGAAELQAMLEALEDCHVTVGWHPSAQYENGMPAAYNALIHEVGVPELGIPQHAMLLPTLKRCENKWRGILRGVARQVRKGRMSLEDGMEMLGGNAAGELQRTIGEIKSPELNKKTIRARERKKEKAKESDAVSPIGSLTKPMQETDYLRSSVSYEVGDGKGDKE